MKINKNETGFSLVELLLVSLVLAVIVFGGYYVYHSEHSNNKSLSTKQTTENTNKNPYAGWDSFSLTNEQATFRYPSSWKLTNNAGPNYTQDSDSVTLTSTGGFTINISTGGLGHPTFDGPTWVLDAVPVTFTGKQGYLDYTSTNPSASNQNESDNKVSLVSVSMSRSNFLDTFTSKASGENETQGGNFVLQASYFDGSGQYIEKSLSSALNDNNYNDFKLLVESMSY